MIKALINISRKWLKVFLALRIRKLGFSVAPIFSTNVKFLDLLFFDYLDEFTIVSSALLPLSLTFLLSSSTNTFGANSGNPVVFNREISSTAILLKP